MFTGLIEDVGELVARQRTGNAGKLVVRTKLPSDEIQVGDSIAVNGACLTVATTGGDGVLTFHTLAETLDRTNLGQCSVGAALNLERALQVGQRLGGHFVMGHVDGTAAIRGIATGADDIAVTIRLPESLAPLLIPKGSIAVNGISLTIAALASDAFTVRIIPHTWKHTNLVASRSGDAVNLEADMLGKYIVRYQALKQGADVTMAQLHQAGF